MSALGMGMAVSAHNVANVSTSGFMPQRAVYATAPASQGVRFDAVLREAAPIAGWSVANATIDVTPGQGLEMPSGTDLAAETARMIATQHSYTANAQVVRAGDAMLGTLLDIRA